MKVLVTGGNGFIGSYLVKELEEHGYDVKIFCRSCKGKNVINGDIRNEKSILKATKGIDAVFHNAALAMDWGKKRDFYETNVKGTENVVKACIENGIERLIYTGSAGVYGFPNSMKPITEESPKKPLNAYQKSKWLGEKVIEEYKKHGIKASIIRPPLVLGAGSKAAQILLSSIENGTFSYIGDGESYITVTHPKDVAKCLRLALEKDDEGNAFNVASFSCRIKDMVEKIAESMNIEKPKKHVSYSIAYIAAVFSEMLGILLNKEPKITRFRVKSMGTNRIISYEKAKKMLGYKPSYDLKKMVEDIVAWYRQ
ncbi:MAG: NAD(P)-dependent oxidoreductase [Thermoplasmata archaeon]|nr:MAG: NAD(P)-dependent oxidoreductase [Thermoplasmata archaeon]